MIKLENLRNRIDVRLVSNEKDYLKWTSEPSCMWHKISGNDLVTIHNSKVTLTLNKPVYIVMCTLELSKVLMHKFHYDYIENKYGNYSRLLLRDTDSLIYEIKPGDDYEDFEEMFY